MYMRAAELGWTLEEFESSSMARFVWEWSGYYRRIERSHYVSTREIYSILYNVNVRKGQQKRSHKLFPLSIDDIQEWTPEDARAQLERVKELGWLN